MHEEEIRKKAAIAGALALLIAMIFIAVIACILH